MIQILGNLCSFNKKCIQLFLNVKWGNATYLIRLDSNVLFILLFIRFWSEYVEKLFFSYGLRTGTLINTEFSKISVKPAATLRQTCGKSLSVEIICGQMSADSLLVQIEPLEGVRSIL